MHTRVHERDLASLVFERRKYEKDLKEPMQNSTEECLLEVGSVGEILLVNRKRDNMKCSCAQLLLL